MYRNYYLYPAAFRTLPAYVENLRYLEYNGYCSTAAPKFVGMPISKDGKFCVLVTKINDSLGGDLVPYRKSCTDELKTQRFADELIRLQRCGSPGEMFSVQNDIYEMCGLAGSQ